MKAIDIHIHTGIGPGYMINVDEVVELYRRNEVVAMPIAWDEESRTGNAPLLNETVADYLKKYPDVFVAGWGCIDPWRGQGAVRQAEHAIKELGLKFQQAAQAFYPNDRPFYP